MKFSLIMATLGRTVEIERLFHSLAAQSHKDFELIVVDQNPDDRVRKIVSRFEHAFKIVYLQSEKGLSKARNVGLRSVTGDLVAFPDDDCWYGPRILEHVTRALEQEPTLDGMTGCSVDENGKLSQGRWASEPFRIDRFNVWISATSYTIFLRAPAVRAVGRFDEQLGVGSGSKWGAGEEVNFLLGAIEKGYAVRYDPTLRINHPDPIMAFDDKAWARGKLYNRGFGRVLALHRYPLYFVLYLTGRAAAGCVLAALKGDGGRARYYWIAATQRVLGWGDRRNYE